MNQEEQAVDRARIRLSGYTPEPADGEQRPRGLICRKCGCTHFFVVYTRPIPGGIRRSRQCRNCGRRAITTETGG